MTVLAVVGCCFVFAALASAGVLRLSPEFNVEAFRELGLDTHHRRARPAQGGTMNENGAERAPMTITPLAVIEEELRGIREELAPIVEHVRSGGIEHLLGDHLAIFVQDVDHAHRATARALQTLALAKQLTKAA